MNVQNKVRLSNTCLYLFGGVIEAFLDGVELRADELLLNQLLFGLLQVVVGLLQPVNKHKQTVGVEVKVDS